jgi:hypothetical protein
MSGPDYSVGIIRPRLKPGVVEPYLGKFQAYMEAQRYRPRSIRKYLGIAHHFGQWLTFQNILANQINDELLSRFIAHRCRCSGLGRKGRSLSVHVVAGARLFVKFLRFYGHIPERPSPAVTARVAAFCDHLQRQVGVTRVTLDCYKRNLLAGLSLLGDEPASYNAAKIRQAALDLARGRAPKSTQTLFTPLRAYLRFLAARGECGPGLDRAVPTIANWKLAALPRYLMPGEVERVIGSCNIETRQGLRDRAILLLLARLVDQF